MTEANRALSRKHTGHSEHPLPTTQETTLHMDIATWSIVKTDWLYSLQLKMENFNTVSKNKTWSWLWLRSWGPYWNWIEIEIELKFSLQLKKAGKTTRPLRYDLNQIPYVYTVGVMNRFKGLGLVDRVPEELWTEVPETIGGSGQNYSPKK